MTLIDGETWIGLGVDVKADIYEGLLEKNAQDIKTGAGLGADGTAVVLPFMAGQSQLLSLCLQIPHFERRVHNQSVVDRGGDDG